MTAKEGVGTGGWEEGWEFLKSKSSIALWITWCSGELSHCMLGTNRPKQKCTIGRLFTVRGVGDIGGDGGGGH